MIAQRSIHDSVIKIGEIKNVEVLKGMTSSYKNASSIKKEKRKQDQNVQLRKKQTLEKLKNF